MESRENSTRSRRWCLRDFTISGDWLWPFDLILSKIANNTFNSVNLKYSFENVLCDLEFAAWLFEIFTYGLFEIAPLVKELPRSLFFSLTTGFEPMTFSISPVSRVLASD